MGIGPVEGRERAPTESARDLLPCGLVADSPLIIALGLLFRALNVVPLFLKALDTLPSALASSETTS